MSKRLFVLTFLIMFFGAIYWSRQKESKPVVGKSTPVVQTTDANLWPMPQPPSHAPHPGSLPSVQVLPEVVRDNRYPEFRGWEPSSLQLCLKALVQQHPRADIRVELDRLIRTGVITLNFQTQDGISALFQVVQKKYVSEHSPGTPDKPEYLVLSVSPDWLASLKTTDEVLEGFLVIYHEYQHYKQWTHGDAMMQMIAKAQEDPELRAKIGLTQEMACKDMWDKETAAYAAECRLANSWNFSHMSLLCESVDTPVWTHAVFTGLASREPYSLYCQRTFAELAGHPNSGMFR